MMSFDLLNAAISTLSATKHRIADAEAHVNAVPGLYAIYGAAETWKQLGLGDPPDTRPLYVGKAERSLKARDLKQHFETGNTGHSTVRRTFSAVLRDVYGFRGIPRNIVNPFEKPPNFALAEEHDAQLTAWMFEHLTIVVWEKPIDCADLHAVEVGVLAHLVPPLNLQDNPKSPWLRQVKTARNVMANDVRIWKAA